MGNFENIKHLIEYLVVESSQEAFKERNNVVRSQYHAKTGTLQLP